MLIKSKTTSVPHEFVNPEQYKSALKKVVKKNVNNIVNAGRTPTLEYLDFSDIVPLETQRETSSDWAVKRLEARGGLDMIALGVLYIARDPVTGIQYCFDGLGRWLIADTAGYVGKVPCLVFEMTQKEAAFYFSYNQNEGRRSLSREVTFVNAWYAGDEEALKLGDILDYCGLYVQGNTHYPVPHPKGANTAEITYRAIKEGYDKIAKKDSSVCKLARDMIYSAYCRTNNGCEKIAQDFFWTVLQVLVTYPESQTGALNKTMQKYIDYLALGNSQTGITKEWKAKGLSGNVAVSKMLAHGFVTSFRKSNFSTSNVEKNMPVSRLGVPKE